MTGSSDSFSVHPSSYRDPSGYIFTHEDTLYRAVTQEYVPHFELLIRSGLYEKLQSSGLLIPHEEVIVTAPHAAKVLKPRRVPFISYPYEWSFEQLKDAALLTLSLEEEALTHGLTLKDASAYNVQFIGCRPVFIDTLSFEQYIEGAPWVAYKQFCEHFLSPLALISLRDIKLRSLLATSLDGIPLDLASTLLPKTSYLSFGLLTHIHLHAKSQRKHSDDHTGLKKPATISLHQRRALIDHLRSTISNLTWKGGDTEWADYYNFTNYTPSSQEEKERIIQSFLKRVPQGGFAWDVGANTGRYSALAARAGHYTIAWDIDPSAIQTAYVNFKKGGADALLPLIQDLINPSPSLGWNLTERSSIVERGPAQVLLALALIHHLAISHNVPLRNIAAFFRSLAKNLIIEFVPKSDSQVKKLLSSRPDIFPQYTQECFERSFEEFFTLQERSQISGTDRILYLYAVKK